MEFFGDDDDDDAADDDDARAAAALRALLGELGAARDLRVLVAAGQQAEQHALAAALASKLRLTGFAEVSAAVRPPPAAARPLRSLSLPPFRG